VLEIETERAVESETPQLNKIPTDEPSLPTEKLSAYEQMEVAYAKAECLSPAKTGKEDDITGKWKLVLEINENDTLDRSCEEIVYHFKKDQTLTVSSNTEEKDAVYEYSPYPLCPVCLPRDPKPNLKMGDATIYCEVLISKMIVYPQTRFTDLGVAYPNHEFQTVFSRIE
jgi:hypothetical protein